MAEQVEEMNNEAKSLKPSIPTGRVKRIMKLDKEISKVNLEALILMSRSTELFLEFLAESSARVALEKKRKTVKLQDLLVAVKRHRPTSDFLLDSLPAPVQSPDKPSKTERTRSVDKQSSPRDRRIDAFFQKCS